MLQSTEIHEHESMNSLFNFILTILSSLRQFVADLCVPSEPLILSHYITRTIFLIFNITKMAYDVTRIEQKHNTPIKVPIIDCSSNIANASNEQGCIAFQLKCNTVDWSTVIPHIKMPKTSFHPSIFLAMTLICPYVHNQCLISFILWTRVS